MTTLLTLGAFALAFAAFLFRASFAKAVDAFHDEPAVLSHDDALTVGMDIAAHLRPAGYLSEDELVANLAAIDTAAAAPLPLRCRRLRRARGIWLARYRNQTLREMHHARDRAAQKARLAALGL